MARIDGYERTLMAPDNGIARLKKHSDATRLSVIKRLEDAMSGIEQRVTDSGAYAGRISVAAICRMASVSPATLQKATHKDSTRVILKKRIAAVLNRLRPPADSVSKPSARAITVASRLNAVCQMYHEAELELSMLRRRVAELEEVIKKSETNKLVSLNSRRKRRES